MDSDAAASGLAAPVAGLSSVLNQVQPWLEWVDLRRVCLGQQACSRDMVRAVHERYLTHRSTSVRARIERLAQRLDGAQAAQFRGSPDARAAAATEIIVLRQCTQVLADNCEKYADLLERVGFTIGIHTVHHSSSIRIFRALSRDCVRLLRQCLLLAYQLVYRALPQATTPMTISDTRSLFATH
eukprot:TRINITY_DN4539_c0_g1_i2.p1 TRINITY_DN4539_c0_g1~~TRINITY_DN4539_c0_g1_i2.p1  ORF type:complete len:184 (-),score=22.54 TRINITY_DN4539_c0_g1_i2:87-638(-)